MTEYDRGRAEALAEAVKLAEAKKKASWENDAAWNACQDIADALRALSTSPGEHVLVPKEPTEAMKYNGGIAFENSAFGEGKLIFAAAGDAYKDMIKSAEKEFARAMLSAKE